MARKKKHPEHVNHERWLVSYADFITLLFAFFVVMFAVSQVDSRKMGRFTESFSKAVGIDLFPESGKSLLMSGNDKVPLAKTEENATPGGELSTLKISLSHQKEKYEELGQVEILEQRNELVLRLSDSLVFDSGDDRVKDPALRVLGIIMDELRGKVGLQLRVEGHTDNVPISTFRFPSNWELSAVRASTVARLFIDNGVTPARLTAAGYADQRPVADNADEEGRGRNRRVTILIESRMADPEGNAGPTTIPPDDPIRSILPEAPQG